MSGRERMVLIGSADERLQVRVIRAQVTGDCCWRQ